MGLYIISGNAFASILFMCIALCFSKDEVTKPTFPDVFEVEIAGLFMKTDKVEEIEGSLYYDIENNRAAVSITLQNDNRILIYNFDSNEYVLINSGECTVENIPDDPSKSYFPFEMDNNKKKKLRSPEAFFYFQNSILKRQDLSVLPTLVYTTTVDIPLYNRENCDLVHVFSKPDIEMPDCTETEKCESRLMTISVKCWNKESTALEVDHVYNFYRFRSGIKDDSVFLPPVGQHCDLKNRKTFPKFSSYFSFSFEIIEDPVLSETDSPVFSMYKKMWYDKEHKIIRIDEFDRTDHMISTRVFDLMSETGFTVVSSTPFCSIGGSTGKNIDLSEASTLPKIFFLNETTDGDAVYVGKRKVHGLKYHVWTHSWIEADADAKIVEEMYFLAANFPDEPLINISNTYMELSHIDIYSYEKNTDMDSFDLSLVKHLAISNFRTQPKEWAAFDVSTCFQHEHKKNFTLKVKGPNVVKDSQSYLKIIEKLYEAIIKVTGISLIRISELRGIFDGLELLEIKGSILDNSNETGWQTVMEEPGMEETFKLIKDAAIQGKLSVTVENEFKKKNTYTVSVSEDNKPSPDTNNCYSGASMAAASLVLLLIGISFGVAGYYVFLKKRRRPAVDLDMTPIKN